MTVNQNSGYLTLRRIEFKPKPVYKDNFHDFANIKNDDKLVSQLFSIIESIESGNGVPEDYYRAGIDEDYDELLDKTGVMHLHLNGKNSDVLVYLVQLEDKVILLETNNHKHLNANPRGKNLFALSQPWYKNISKK